MELTFESHAEPIPGYRLIARIGEGGFGEVWKAEAPGGLLKAVKIIQAGAGLDASRLDQELKSLHRVKSIRHPYILSLDRFEIVHGRLIIISELADRTLFDRFTECRFQGHAGIPRQELLGYMRETAEALDLMNAQFNLQHLDIKPQNIFLLFNHVKLGDFGLVKDLEGMCAAVTSGLTAVYAPPETFGGLVSRYCDQYNLAISYQEMLTGELPFNGKSARHLMMQHLTGLPNLTPLRPADQPVVARALAKKPEERFASCVEFVHALERCSVATTPGEIGTGASRSSLETLPEVPLCPTPTPLAGQATKREGGDPGRRHESRTPPRARGQSTRALGGVPSSLPPGEHRLVATLEPRPGLEQPSRWATGSVPPPPERPETTGDGILLPALVVGLGGLGQKVLQEFRTSLRKRGRSGNMSADTWPHIRLLHIDSDFCGYELAAQQPDSIIRPDEFLVTPFQGLSHTLSKHHEREELEGWFPVNQLTNVPRGQTAAAGWRALGRLALVSSGNIVPSRFRQELQACTNEKTLSEVARQTSLGLRTTRPRVYVVTSLMGGSGSGMFLDVAAALRRELRQIGHARAELVGVFLAPKVYRNAEARDVANSYAALRELQHFAALAKDLGIAAPFDRCMLLPLPARTDGDVAVQEVVALAGDLLCRELTTCLGRVADEARNAIGRGSADTSAKQDAAGITCQSFGAYWFSVPRRPLLRQVVRHIFDRMVQGWGTHDANAMSAAIRDWAQGQLAQANLSPKSVLHRLEELCAATLGQPTKAWFEALIGRWAPGAPGDLLQGLEAPRKALAELEQALGSPETAPDLQLECPVLSALAGACLSVVKQAEQQLPELPFAALGEPRFRLSCKEETAQEELGVVLGETARWCRGFAAEQRKEAFDLWQQIPPHCAELQLEGALRSEAKTHAAAAIRELASQCLSARWSCLLALAIDQIFEKLRVNLHRHSRTSLRCCHKRIGKLLDTFAPAGKTSDGDLGLGHYLLPFGCKKLEEAVRRILDRLPPEEEWSLHERVENLIRSTFSQYMHVCTAPTNLFRELRERIDCEVEKLAEESLGRAHAAEVYLERQADNGDADADLQGAFDEAQPEFGNGRRAAAREFTILAVPVGPEGERFRALVKHALPDEPMHAAASTDDIVFYREQSLTSLDDLPQLGQSAREQYQQILAAPFGPHSRTDIISSGYTERAAER
jgi:serine/threonine protein kinase